VLEPGGTISFIGKKPGSDETRHLAMMKRMDQVMAEIAKLQKGQAPSQA
jgi:cytochrome c556